MARQSALKRPLVIVVGLLCIAAGAALFFSGGPLKLVGIILISLSPFVLNFLRDSPAVRDPALNLYVVKYHNFLRSWPIGMTVIVSLALSFYLLHLDAISGGNSVFVVYYFAASGVAAMVYWVYLSGWTNKKG